MEIKNLAKEVILISQDATFTDALNRMLECDTNSLFVVNEQGALVGEVNVSDLLDAIIPTDITGDTIETQFGTEVAFAEAVQKAKDTPVIDFMNPEVHSVRATDSLISIAAIAIANQTAHLPIVDHDDRPIGVISRRALKHILGNFLEN